MLAIRGEGDYRTARLWLALIAAFAMLVALVPQRVAANEPPAGPLTPVIVREAPGAGDGPERLVESVGGTVGQSLGLIGGFSASVPSGAIGVLAASPDIVQVTPNAVLELSKAGWEDASTLSSADPQTSSSSLYEVARYMRADEMWDEGYVGSGVDVALIDSGVVPVEGLTTSGKILNGPDLSFESQHDSLRYLDTFGHGTHMAGIIAGRDNKANKSLSKAASESFVGIAPGARIVSIKVADAHGVTDVSQVIAAIDWVVQHRHDADLNIRVLNLSFGTNSTQPYVLDPLAYAVEQAWNAGIVVVVAAGNDGNEAPLRNPAIDPFVIAVGAVDTARTKYLGDDVIAGFSNCGTSDRSVDIVAHGRSITSLRAPGSYADLENPGSVVAERLFVGSGTSQAAAVVSGAVALLLDENPNLSPDQVKSLLVSEALPLNAESRCQGGGAVDAFAAAKAEVPSAREVAQPHAPSTGAGSLDGSRGSDRITADGVVLEGEQDIMGNAWIGFNTVVTTCVVEEVDDTYVEPTKVLEPGEVVESVEVVELVEVVEEPIEDVELAEADVVSLEGDPKLAVAVSEDVSKTVKVCTDHLEPTNTLWSAGDWNGATWTGASWSGASWSGASWSSVTWAGASWSGASWSSVTWSGASWSGASWSGASWSGASWSSVTWAGASWSGASWSGLDWLGLSWH